MRPDAPDGWQRLTCSCGTERFASAVYLLWKPGSGITQEPGGFFCLECHGMIDSAALIAKASLKAKQQELRDLESEISDMPSPKVAVMKGK